MGLVSMVAGTSLAVRVDVAVGLGVVAVLLSLWALLRSARADKRRRHRREPLPVVPAPSEHEIVQRERFDDYERSVAALEDRLRIVENASRTGLSRVGLKRFNAFENTGAELSFSLALLNDQGTGAVVTGLWGRDESRLFAKPIHEQTSRYPLSEEEYAAIELAMLDRGRVSVQTS